MNYKIYESVVIALNSNAGMIEYGCIMRLFTYFLATTSFATRLSLFPDCPRDSDIVEAYSIPKKLH